LSDADEGKLSAGKRAGPLWAGRIGPSPSDFGKKSPQEASSRTLVCASHAG
jgi:hypothetical protein